MKWIYSVVLASMVGCASFPDNEYIWRNGATATSNRDKNRDYLQCEYEAESNARSRTSGLRTDVGRELDRRDHRDELIGYCMKARGYTVRLEDQRPR